MSTNGRKDSEIQATEGPPDPELDSLIAPQGYDAELVDDVATMQTPAQQRRSALKFFIFLVIILAIAFWLCTPANFVAPDLQPAPYSIHERPLPPSDKFLSDAIPRTVGNFKMVDLKSERVYEEPYIGANTLQATYVNDIGQPVSVVVIEAESYINARRYLENYKKLLNERTEVTEWEERLFIDENFIQWAAPTFADRAYGLAWNNEQYFISVTSPISAAQQALAEDFPY